MSNDSPKDGVFEQMLKRNNKQLRDDRAQVIITNTEKFYRRKVEDLQDELNQIEVDRQNMMDVNPGNTQTIINPNDFNAEAFVQNDTMMAMKARETRIKLEEARNGYIRLFGTGKLK